MYLGTIINPPGRLYCVLQRYGTSLYHTNVMHACQGATDACVQ